MTAAERIFDILDTKADIVDAADVTELPEVQGRVEFSHVSFTYDKGTPAETKVLSDVSFVVEPGETIALVGPTGAGKTTIVNLISRFYDIEDGVISVDGYDLTEDFHRKPAAADGCHDRTILFSTALCVKIFYMESLTLRMRR